MRNKIFSMIALIVFLGFIVFNITIKSQVKKQFIDMENVEALASGEGYPTYNCPGGSALCVIVNSPKGTHNYFKN